MPQADKVKRRGHMVDLTDKEQAHGGQRVHTLWTDGGQEVGKVGPKRAQGTQSGHMADTCGQGLEVRPKRTPGGHEADTRRTHGGHKADMADKMWRCGQSGIKAGLGNKNKLSVATCCNLINCNTCLPEEASRHRLLENQ